ncbi:hypothetical protein CK500_10490 [Halorubrum salipaludis]|uniref:Uncharacterized protein n=1 Tax=Halorubrum salipaludis TaxID=2032630 RepID=A0A2A2FF06_9EURY|nr:MULTISPECIES: hypothetical protein [Halorubrum]PAU83222.1 hypothetical protein CK500_10490 [Halorubrum salipaludis]
MASDPPAESATERPALRWSDSGGSAAAGAEARGDDRTEGPRDAERAVADDDRDVERLEAELERKEEQLRYVTEQYEELLAEKNERLADDGDDDRGRTTLRSRLAGYLPDLR